MEWYWVGSEDIKVCGFVLLCIQLSYSFSPITYLS